MELGDLRDQLLATARRDFATFYATANPRDIAVFEALVLAHAVFVVAMNVPRVGLREDIRTELERATNGNEGLFTELREEVRRCATFCALPDMDQIAIERTLFDVKPPLLS